MIVAVSLAPATTVTPLSMFASVPALVDVSVDATAVLTSKLGTVDVSLTLSFDTPLPVASLAGDRSPAVVTAFVEIDSVLEFIVKVGALSPAIRAVVSMAIKGEIGALTAIGSAGARFREFALPHRLHLSFETQLPDGHGASMHFQLLLSQGTSKPQSSSIRQSAPSFEISSVSSDNSQVATIHRCCSWLQAKLKGHSRSFWQDVFAAW